jgi:hypothetical protein
MATILHRGNSKSRTAGKISLHRLAGLLLGLALPGAADGGLINFVGLASIIGIAMDTSTISGVSTLILWRASTMDETLSFCIQPLHNKFKTLSVPWIF